MSNSQHTPHFLATRRERLLIDDSGMSTVEYAIGTIAAAALAGVLYLVVTGGTVSDLLSSLIQKALSVKL